MEANKWKKIAMEKEKDTKAAREEVMAEEQRVAKLGAQWRELEAEARAICGQRSGL